MSLICRQSDIVDPKTFSKRAPGRHVTITGQDAVFGAWQHPAFVPNPLDTIEPELSPATYRAVAEARAALAALDSTARQLPNPALMRHPTLRREAQSAPGFEGTYAPLNAVMIADAEEPSNAKLTEIINYVHAASHAFGWVTDSGPIAFYS